MLSVRIWNLESDHDAKAVKFLEDEFVRFRQLGQLVIRKTGRSALRKCHRKGVPLKESLRKAIQHYLKQDDYIIFLIDAEQQRQQESSPLIEQLRHVVKECGFSDRISFAPDIQEYEPPIPMQWQSIVSCFRTEVESDRKQLREKWDRTMAHFHKAFAHIPEEEVIRHFEEAITEVRREQA